MLAFLQEKEKLEMEKSEGESIRKNSTQKIKAVSNTVNMEFIVYIMINLNFYGDTKGLQYNIFDTFNKKKLKNTFQGEHCNVIPSIFIFCFFNF